MTGDPTGVDALYPFLSSDGGKDLDSVLEEVRRSTVEKAEEVVALREQCLAEFGPRLAVCAGEMADRFARGGRLLAFGNGGSSTDAQDAATMFLHPEGGSGGLARRRVSGGGTAPASEPPGANGPRPLPALALTADVAVVTALSNDVGFEVVFSRQIAALGRAQDIALGLSTSGNSDNLVRAFDEAARRGLLTVGLAGYEGGKMAETDTIDHLFVVPSSSVHRIQEAQTTVYHVLWELTQRALEDHPSAVRPDEERA